MLLHRAMMSSDRLCENDLEDRLGREEPSESEIAEPADPPDDP
jgi:hypothetical protein